MLGKVDWPGCGEDWSGPGLESQQLQLLSDYLAKVLIMQWAHQNTGGGGGRINYLYDSSDFTSKGQNNEKY